MIEIANFVFQASELASSIQSQRDLGCHASQIVQLEEGLNCDSSLAADFWSRLGGRAQYRGSRSISPGVNCFQATVFIIFKVLTQ